MLIYQLLSGGFVHVLFEEAWAQRHLMMGQARDVDGWDYYSYS